MTRAKDISKIVSDATYVAEQPTPLPWAVAAE